MDYPRSDFRIEYKKGSGPGGQHRNKVETACTVIHIPTGLKQSCQASRSKSTNYQTAMKMLVSKLHAIESQKKHDNLNQSRQKAIHSETIRTYNFQRQEVKDHRSGKTASLNDVLNGKIDFINLSN